MAEFVGHNTSGEAIKSKANVGYYDTKSTCPSLAKAGEDEPIFVLRAQDASAPSVVRAWLASNPQISAEKRANAEITIAAMQRWHKRKVAD